MSLDLTRDNKYPYDCYILYLYNDGNLVLTYGSEQKELWSLAGGSSFLYYSQIATPVTLKYGRSLNNTTPLGNYHMVLKPVAAGGI